MEEKGIKVAQPKGKAKAYAAASSKETETDWDGFEDDESGALGIISSVQPTTTVNKRHMTPEQRAAARRGAGFSFADHPALSAVAALVGALAAAYGCATMRRADEAPKENPCCGGKYKEAQA